MTPTPWKALDMDANKVDECIRSNRYAMVIGPDGAVIIARMNRPDAHHLVHCVNAINAMQQQKGLAKERRRA